MGTLPADDLATISQALDRHRRKVRVRWHLHHGYIVERRTNDGWALDADYGHQACAVVAALDVVAGDRDGRALRLARVARPEHCAGGCRNDQDGGER